MELVQIATFGTVTEANLVKAKLDVNGIESIVQADVMTTSIPTMDQLHGVKVLVREPDLAEAYEVLERMLPPGNSSGDAPEPQ